MVLLGLMAVSCGGPVVQNERPEPKANVIGRLKIISTSNIAIPDSGRLSQIGDSTEYLYNAKRLSGEVRFTVKNLDNDNLNESIFCWAKVGKSGTIQGISTSTNYKNTIDIKFFSFPNGTKGLAGKEISTVKVIHDGDKDIKSIEINVSCRFPDGTIIAETVESSDQGIM